MYFIYGEAELAYLRRKDKRLAAVIDRIGPVERTPLHRQAERPCRCHLC